jgi:hypothetical protein
MFLYSSVECGIYNLIGFATKDLYLQQTNITTEMALLKTIKYEFEK